MIALLSPILFAAFGMIYFSEKNFKGFLRARISCFNEEVRGGRYGITRLFDQYETEAIHLVGSVL